MDEPVRISDKGPLNPLGGDFEECYPKVFRKERAAGSPLLGELEGYVEPSENMK